MWPSSLILPYLEEYALKPFKLWAGVSDEVETPREFWNAVSEEKKLICLAYLFLLFAPITFFALMYCMNAKYGRYAGQAWFTEYSLNSRFAWFLQEAPSLVAPMLALHYYGEQLNLARFLAFAMFAGHYFQRTMIYPFLTSGGKKSPPQYVAASFGFCAINGYMQAFYHVQYAPFADDHYRDLVSQAGFVIFLTGMVINIHSDSILRNLRKPGERGYKQPNGGFFEYVSCANFLGEIVEWIGYAIYCRTWPAFAMALFTFANLVPRAATHHEYYKKKINRYPQDRKAVIPFIY